MMVSFEWVQVKPGDILVGKVTRSRRSWLLRRSSCVRSLVKRLQTLNASLVVPSGVQGIVMNVKVSTRVDGEPEQMSASDRRRQIKKINEEYRSQSDRLREDCGGSF